VSAPAVSAVGLEVPALDLALVPGEVVAVLGPSRTGKTTLVELLAGWTRPTTGTVTWGDGDRPPPWAALTVVPQELALVEELTVGENVGFAHRFDRGLVDRIDEVMARVGITHLRDRGAFEISVGERQRTMVARALAGRPAVVLADEPVAHQDSVRAEAVLALLRERADEGAAVLLATRDPAFTHIADRVLTL
jgi:putative ABC transport system ATP-binding protein